MKSEAAIKQYIFDWLKGLNIGQVYQDRKPWDDVTKLRDIRTYIVYDFPDGISNEGAWWHGTCTVCIGCRDKQLFVPNLEVLDKACTKFINEFDKNDDENGIQILDYEFIDDYRFGEDAHEYQYAFDVYARMTEEEAYGNN